MEATNWLPEHSAALRYLRARGMSYAEIADTINARFNTAYTRNAAICRGQRMGLGSLDRLGPSLLERPVPDSPSLEGPSLEGPSLEGPSLGCPGPGHPDQGRPGIDRRREVPAESWADILRWRTAFSGKVDLPELRCVEVAPRHLSLVELECGDCRYPYGGDAEGDPITFCGHPCQPDSSYCTPHFRLSRNPELSAAPVLSTGWLRAVGAV